MAQALFDKIKDNAKCKSLLKKNLTQELVDKLKDTKTSNDGTLADCIKSGCENPESSVGVYACDPEAYTVFKDLLDPVIKDYHKVDSINHPTPDFGDLKKLPFGDLDPENKYVVSTRVRVGRSHAKFGFPPILKPGQRKEMEKISVDALKTLTDEWSGEYYPLEGMTRETQDKLTEDHFLFNDKDRFLREAGGYIEWPIGRGIFHNKNKTFLVWVNEEDHLRLISMQMGGNLGEVYTRLVKGIQKLEEKLTFAKRDGLGYLTFCPTNLGTTMRASVHMKVPNLAADSKKFEEICAKYNIQARGIHGEHTESVGGVYDLSNKRRLGLTEIQAAKEMADGVTAILKAEKEAEAKQKK